ncbi:unnamed protein product [Brachionus calyciflorus]|uniref:Tc1-like transposase DDE domain-containing protein n=1 Tax=Brachionus calyciflorus TaxID=104777 RepID=A0A814MGD3_9BILA|nr:unnamed protein product [Brachionus calyciflorus]
MADVGLLKGGNNSKSDDNFNDCASAHTAHSIRDWFKEQNIEVLPWCPRSPDLCPIENLWSFMDAKLVNTRITSIDHLKQVLNKEWLSVTTE